MHEMGITQGILSAAFDAAKGAGADRICEIRISIGELTEIQEFALQFAFEALTPGTMAENATLLVTHIPATSKCNECGVVYEHDRFEMLCPECGAFNVRPLTGRELRIDSIETPDDGEPCATAAGRPAPTDDPEE
ncbi:MAG TPA: hydrogenase maturation nickel metallochaperone HypA [Coriobacteriia bacterium]